MGLSIDANIAETVDFWGKHVSDLQTGIEFDGNEVSGTLKYVADFSSAFGSGLDSGNYIAIHCSVPDAADATISVQVTGRDASVLDDDGLCVAHIADKSSQTITVVASKSGYDSVTRVLDLTGLTLNAS